MHESILIETDCYHEILILKQQHAKSVTDAFILTKFTLENSNTFKIEHALLTSCVAIFAIDVVPAYITSQLISPK